MFRLLSFSIVLASLGATQVTHADVVFDKSLFNKMMSVSVGSTHDNQGKSFCSSPIINGKKQIEAVVFQKGAGFACDDSTDNGYPELVLVGKKNVSKSLSRNAEENVFIESDVLAQLVDEESEDAYDYLKNNYIIVPAIQAGTNQILGYQMLGKSERRLNGVGNPTSVPTYNPYSGGLITSSDKIPVYGWDPAAGRSVLISGTAPVYSYDYATNSRRLTAGYEAVYSWDPAAGRNVIIGYRGPTK